LAGLNLYIKKRLLTIMIVFTILIIALVLRLGWIQIVNGDWYQKMAFEQQTRGRDISPKRGTIFDRNGKVLAISASVEKVSLNPKQFRESVKDLEKSTQELADLLGMKTENVLNKIQKKSSYEVIIRRINNEVGDKVRQWGINNKINGLYVDEDSQRFYPNKNLASHVLGFTGTDNQGLDGIEAVMDKYLKGVPGRILSGKDAKNNEIPFTNEEHIDAQDGANLVLTIDETIQYFVEKELEKAVTENKVLNGATAIVMDPRNGEILALDSKPDFDPNSPFAMPKGFELTQWNAMTTDEKKVVYSKVWRNKAVSDTYEPGSTFKAITSAAGLEEGIVTPDSKVTDFPIKVEGWPKPIKCWRYYRPHGGETFSEGVYNSCNPVFVKVALDLGIEKFYKYIKAFGFYDKTGIMLPGEEGSIIHKKPKEADMAVTSFGQRLTITPIQLIQAYGAIANGGNLIKPNIIKEITDSENNIIKKFEPEIIRNVVSKKTSETLRQILEGVVSVDTATGGNAYVPGFRVAGKTGTSETLEDGHFIASFSSFAPADNPVLCILVILDNPKGPFGHGGGMIAAPVVKNIMEASLDYLGIERKYNEKDLEKLEQQINVPDVRGMSIKEARKILGETEIDLKYKIEGQQDNNDAIIMDQMPKPDASLTKKSIVILYTYKTQQQIKVKMPDLQNETVSEATDRLNKAGLNIMVNGSGIVVKQEYPAGSGVEKGTLVEVEFRNPDMEEGD
jgi:stage V sporulation protein D (sporulation-specific penicillin-binding protein)